MTRSRRSSGKATAKQNQERIAVVESTVNELINAVSGDIGRVNGLIFGILTHFKLLKEFECPQCKQHIIQPLLEALPPQDNCPKCNHTLEKEMVTLDTFTNWDEGKASEEE